MSVEARASCTTTCASETDDGDYETSSEGAIREMQGKQIKEILLGSPEKIGSELDYDIENPELKEQKSSEGSSYNPEVTFASAALTKSESMPVLKNTSSSIEDNDKQRAALASESCSASERKMKMIVARTVLLPSSASNSTVSSDVSKIDVIEEKFESKKVEPKIVPPVIQTTAEDAPICTKEVTFDEPLEDNKSPKGRNRNVSSSRGSKDREKSRITQEIDDLIGIAENPHPSIKSFYFPPIPEREDPSPHWKPQSRIIKDKEAIMKINGELGPLQQKLSEICGRCRALLSPKPSQNHYSTQYVAPSTMSGYYLHRTETFGRDSNVKNITRLTDHSSNYYGTTSWYSTSKENGPLTRDPFSLDEFVSRNASAASNARGRSVANQAGNCPVQENDNYISGKNSYHQFGSGLREDPSGSLITSGSNSCYRCHRNRASDYQHSRYSYYDGPEIGGYSDGFAKRGEMASTSGRQPCQTHRDTFGHRKVDKVEAATGSGKLINTLDTSTVTSGPEVRVISVNTSLERRFDGGIIGEKNSGHEEPGIMRKNSKNNSCSSLNKTHDQSVSASLTVIGSDGSSRTRFVNYTRVNSQASLVFSKKDQHVMTSDLDRTGNECLNSHSRKELRDSDARCSNVNLKEVIVKKSVETLLKPSESVESGTSGQAKDLKSVRVAKSREEKVVIVPILFTDGIPEPPKAPLFNFTRSKCRLAKGNHHLAKLDKRSSSVTQNSVISVHSGGSSAMETSYLNQRLTNRNSGMSVSCVSRTGSSLRYGNPSHLSTTVKTMSDYHRSRGRHSHHSSKAHSEPTKRTTEKVIHGMRSSPEEFLCDT